MSLEKDIQQIQEDVGIYEKVNLTPELVSKIQSQLKTTPGKHREWKGIIEEELKELLKKYNINFDDYVDYVEGLNRKEHRDEFGEVGDKVQIVVPVDINKYPDASYDDDKVVGIGKITKVDYTRGNHRKWVLYKGKTYELCSIIFTIWDGDIRIDLEDLSKSSINCFSIK